MNMGYVSQYNVSELKFASEAGFDGLEIRVVPGAQADLNKGKGHIKKIKDDFDKYDLKVLNVAVSINHLHPNIHQRQKANTYFKHAIEKVHLFGTRLITTNTWGNPSKTPYENLRMYKKVFSEYAKIAGDCNVKIAMENCPHVHAYPITIHNMGYQYDILERMFSEVSSKNIGLQHDPSHYIWLGIDYLKGIELFKDKIFSIHAKDTEILPEKREKVGIYEKGWWRYRMPGLGQVNWDAFFAHLYEIEYDGDIIIEHEDPVFDGKRRKEGLKRGKKFLDKYFI